jgi:radical SAM protein with 4Fe4S-binding SPASM domain
MKKAYFEITNVCNLKCSFCPNTKREKRFVSLSEFEQVAPKLQGRVEYLYFHLMGEPTLHPQLAEFLKIAYRLGFKVIITTNGTTLGEKGAVLFESEAVYKISISLHSFEANEKNRTEKMTEYLLSCFDFSRRAAEKGKICVFRLWNLDGENTVGENSDNPVILTQMKQYFGSEWADTRSGKRICDKIFLEYGEKFEWPDPESVEVFDEDADCFCHGLRDQMGILCDGTVVPCCLDSEGTVKLGNIFENTLEEILASPKAVTFYNSFTKRKSPSALCSNCGYAKRFSKKR